MKATRRKEISRTKQRRRKCRPHLFLTLNYHIIDRTIQDSIAISEEAFEAQMAYLREHGYRALSIQQAIDDIYGRRSAPPRSLLLTFDDGYADNVRTALPILQQYGMRATLFVISAYVGQRNRWNPRACYDTLHMTWDDLRFWLAGGCDFGGHSHQHLCMTRLDEEELLASVQVNKRLLEEQLHISPRAFAYPYGRFNQAVQEVVRQHYEVAFAVERGGWNAPADRYAINRVMVLPTWSLAEFGEQLSHR
ncbi:MAG TPA: polysaccharide deacetylase family protein [Ktedonobacteraceae bacterium]|nr:polysaccharide deacetylase family protein [Ktedonobacteraceae bacterium]